MSKQRTDKKTASGRSPAAQRNRNGSTAAKPTLAQKLLKVAGLIPEIDKDGHNDHQDYDFASAENVLRKVREPLAAAGILLLSDLVEVTERATKTPRGKDTTITTVRVKFTFVDTETGKRLESTWAGTGDDPSDKGIYKAYTGCIKTFLRSTFMLPLGDDPEADTRADQRHEDNGAGQDYDPEKKLSEGAVEKLRKAIAEAGIDSAHVSAKLRSFGVDSIEELTNEQGVAMYGWVGEAKGGES